MRTYSSDDPVRNPDPALDPVAYDKVCQRDAGGAGLRPAALLAGAADGDLDAAPACIAFSWDLRYQPLGEGGGAAAAALRCRTARIRRVERAVGAAGNYTVRLTVDGKSYTQPLTLHLDPRVKTPAVGAHDTVVADARDVRGRQGGARRRRTGARARGEARRDERSRHGRVQGSRRGRWRHRQAPVAVAAAAVAVAAAVARPRRASLDALSTAMLARGDGDAGGRRHADGARDRGRTEARRQSAALTAKWTKLTTVDLPALNAKRKAAGQPPIDWQPKQKSSR